MELWGSFSYFMYVYALECAANRSDLLRKTSDFIYLFMRKYGKMELLRYSMVSIENDMANKIILKYNAMQ